jgi:hypothetical protein
MGFRDSINAEWGVIKFLGEKGLIETGRRGKINRFVCEFLTENSLTVAKHNPRYRGNYDALNKNCDTVQENWDVFHQWVNKKCKEE